MSLAKLKVFILVVSAERKDFIKTGPRPSFKCYFSLTLRKINIVLLLIPF